MKKNGPSFTLAAVVALAAGAALALAGSFALAQQPGQVGPRTFPPIMPGQQRTLPHSPPSHPGVPGMMPPGGRQGRPPVPPPRTRPGRPGGAGKPLPTRRHAVPEEEDEHGDLEPMCPGHGSEDPPPEINVWRGMLMVDNERALKPDFLNQLLFRYEDPRKPCDPRNRPPPLLASVLNFGVLAYILYRFARKPLTEALVKRKQSIMEQIDLADELYDKALARLEAYEEKLENIEARREELRAEHVAQAEAEQKHILADAEERRVRLRKDAEFRVEQERKVVRDALLEEAVVASTAAAEALIQKQISRADQDHMAADYLASVGAAFRRGNEPRPQGART